jgi:hypothetical protein
MQLSAPAPPLPDSASAPPSVAGVIAVLLSKNPANRYASAARAKQALEEAASAADELGGTMAVGRKRAPAQAKETLVSSELPAAEEDATIDMARRRPPL